MKIITTIAVSAILLSGCTHLKRSSISYPNNVGENDSFGRLFIWDADVSAGVGSDKGICVQSAVTDTGMSGTVGLDIIEDVVVGLSGSQNVVVLNPSNAQTTYASTAYFAICQLALNGAVDKKDIVELFAAVSETATQIGLTETGAQTLDAPEITNIIKDVLSRGVAGASDVEIETLVEGAMSDKP